MPRGLIRGDMASTWQQHSGGMTACSGQICLLECGTGGAMVLGATLLRISHIFPVPVRIVDRVSVSRFATHSHSAPLDGGRQQQKASEIQPQLLFGGRACSSRYFGSLHRFGIGESARVCRSAFKFPVASSSWRCRLAMLTSHAFADSSLCRARASQMQNLPHRALSLAFAVAMSCCDPPWIVCAAKPREISRALGTDPPIATIRVADFPEEPARLRHSTRFVQLVAH